MSSAAEELLTAVSSAEAQSRESTAVISAATSAAESADSAFQIAGGADKLALVATIRGALDEAIGMQSQVEAKLAEAYGWAEQLNVGKLGPTPTASGPTSPTESGEASDARSDVSKRWAPPLPGFSPRRPHPEAEREMRRVGWPRSSWRKSAISARAHVYDGNGRRMTDEPPRPHHPNGAPACEDLREPWRSDECYTTTWHVERDAGEQIRDAVKAGHTGPFAFYLNTPMCGRPPDTPPYEPHPKRCTENFPALVPEGTEVYVHVVNQRGTRVRRIEGAGEAIA